VALLITVRSEITLWVRLFHTAGGVARWQKACLVKLTGRIHGAIVAAIYRRGTIAATIAPTSRGDDRPVYTPYKSCCTVLQDVNAAKSYVVEPARG